MQADNQPDYQKESNGMLVSQHPAGHSLHVMPKQVKGRSTCTATDDANTKVMPVGGCRAPIFLASPISAVSVSTVSMKWIPMDTGEPLNVLMLHETLFEPSLSVLHLASPTSFCKWDTYVSN